jgi:predicted amidohydrolase
MLVASIQMAGVEGDKAGTIDKARECIYRARGADLIVLPELWNIGFMSFDRYIPEAEAKDGPTLTALKKSAREVKAYIHTGSFVEREGDRYYNASYLLSPEGEILASYRKIHLFGYNSRENQILSRGDQVVVVRTPLGGFGLATCYDLRFPELFRRMVEQEVEVFLICSAWPYPRLEHWIMLNRVRALENQCFLVSANSAGQNQGIMFAGHSMMVDPWGVIVASGRDDEVILRGELDTHAVKDARDRFPAFIDRQPWLNKSA